MDGFTIATALMGLFPAVWQILNGLATSKFCKRLLNQQKKHFSSNESIKAAVSDNYNQLEDFVQELNSWIGLIDSNHNGVLDAFAVDSDEVSDLIESVIRDLKSIKKDAQSILMRHNSSKQLISNTNSPELMEVLGLNQRTLKIIRRVFEFMVKELRNMGITEQNSNYNQYQLSARSNNPANVTNINIISIFVGDCDKTSTERQLQMVAQMVNQIMKLNVNDTDTNNVPLQLWVKSRDHGSDLIRPSRFRRKPSFKQVSPVSEDINTEQDMRVYFNDEFSESRSELSNNFSFASISDSYPEEQKSGPSSLQDDRTRSGKTAIKSPLKLEGIDVKMCRMSDELTLNGINCTSNKKLEHGTFLSYELSYGGSDDQNGNSAVGSLMGDKNIFELGKIVSNAEQGKLAFYTECEVLKSGTKLGLGLAVAGSSDEFKYFKKDKMAGRYNKSCGFDGRLGKFYCSKSLEMDYCCGRAPGWPAGGVPQFAEGERLGMGVRLSKGGSKGEVFFTRNGALLRHLDADFCWMDLRKLWKSDSWGSAPSSIREADIRLVVALAGSTSAVRLNFFENMPSIPIC